MWVVADRLSQADGEWRPFEMNGRAGALYDRVSNLVIGAA
jgi:hypothetical protein